MNSSHNDATSIHFSQTVYDFRAIRDKIFVLFAGIRAIFFISIIWRFELVDDLPLFDHP